MMRSLASQSIVLLKNEDKILPVSLEDDTITRIAVIGPNAKARLVSGKHSHFVWRALMLSYLGGGSASLKASYFVTPYEGIENAVKAAKGHVEVLYHEGVRGVPISIPSMS